MLKNLYISNFALIEEMEVSFPGNLTVITGETGAGKSIFLEALSLALGNRADLSSLQNKNKKCIIEAEFNLEGLDFSDFFEEYDLDVDATILLRREISTDGKSRSFLNDTPVSLNALKVLSQKLIDIHSQHQTLLLNQTNFQIELLDAFAGNLKYLSEYKVQFGKFNKLSNHLKNLKDQETQAKKELDYYQFLFDELQEADIKKNELLQLEEESLALENAESIKSSLLNSANLINGGDKNLISMMAQVKQNLNSLSKYGNNYSQFFDRINSIYIELKDLANDLEIAETEVQFDTTKLDAVNTKLDRLNRLLKKHNVKSDIELLEIKTDLEKKLTQFGSIESEINDTQKQLDVLLNDCNKLAKKLSDARINAISDIELQVKSSLNDLSMQNANFNIEINQIKELTANGIDQVKFLFSANKGASLNELHKVASGGELSRLMLCLKALLASKKKLPSIIFDEIDTGVSGEVADKIGNILLKMGKSMQVVTITHLPQMASKGNHHLFVYKNDDENKTVSYIKELTTEERINEIAKMLSTGNPTPIALKNAKELLYA
jgi:DNA repair protein RecN (Recombination protein N)